MPLNACGWTTEEDKQLADLVQPHPFLYNVQDPSRKNILAREESWQDIAQTLSKPVEECKKRWRGLRDGYMRSKRLGSLHKTKASVFEKLQFLDEVCAESTEEEDAMEIKGEQEVTEQQVITDNQEYYEITVVDGPHKPEVKPPPATQLIKILPKTGNLQQRNSEETQTKMKRAPGGGRKRTLPRPTTNVQPIKILPKPILMNRPNLVRYIEDVRTPEQRSQTIDKLIERVLKENTNEVDVFFRSMAASVKKLQPNLIPKVKMEVCNVIAKYEMQNFEKGGQL